MQLGTLVCDRNRSVTYSLSHNLPSPLRREKGWGVRVASVTAGFLNGFRRSLALTPTLSRRRLLDTAMTMAWSVTQPSSGARGGLLGIGSWKTYCA